MKPIRHLISYSSLAIVLMLVGCSLQAPWLPTSGPSTQAIREYVPPTGISIRVGGIRVVEVDSTVAERVKTSLKRKLFSEVFVMAPATDFRVGGGDTLEVSIWEAPPATLFGSAPNDLRSGPATSTLTAFPEQMVNMAGQINVPFAGAIPVIGKTTAQIEVEIAKRLKGKANQPQVLVRVMKNASANVTVVGDFANSTNMQLTAKRERLLDAVAAAGGVRQPVSKMTVELTRKSTVMSLPLETIIHDPRQNIVLQAGDVVTALNKPLSFLVLGATGKNEELDFEAQGITLAQALARAGGLQDARADAQGVFIFRFEDPSALELDSNTKLKMTIEGKIPVIYKVDLKNPAIFFAAQSFPMRDKDVMFVSNAPAAELQKFLSIIGSVVAPVAAARVISQ